MRYIWLSLAIVAVSTGVVAISYAAAGNLRGEDFALTMGWGVGMLVLGVLSFAKMFQKAFRTWWSYAGRWVGAWMCCQSILLAALMLAKHEADTAAAVFFIVFPALLVPVLMFVRFKPSTAVAEGSTAPASPTVPPLPASTSAPPMAGATETDRRIGQHAAFDQSLRRRGKGRKRRRSGEPRPSLIARLFGFVRDMAVGAVVTWLLLVALVIGVALAMDVPGMLAAGVPDPSVADHITGGLGFDGWPHLFRMAGSGVGLVALLLASLVLIVARRRTYGLHMLRAMAGVAVFGLSLVLLGRALADGEWHRVPGRGAIEASSLEGPEGPAQYVGPQRVAVHIGHGEWDRDFPASFAASLERYLRDARPATVTLSGCVGLLAIILICWPARRPGDRRAARHVAVQQNFGTVVHAPPAPASAVSPATAAASSESN
jgi:hypothetical protein